LLWFTDSAGVGVEGVALSPPLARYPGLISDSYGRALLRIAKGEEVHATTERSGYVPEKIDLACRLPLEKEVPVELKKMR
jgi:hypothetical protein